MLDDIQVLRQRDPQDALGVAANQWEQATFEADIVSPDHDGREIKNVVIAGMGGSALAALVAKAWLKDDIRVPFEVVRDYDLPSYVDKNTLVIGSSYSGNTEETISAFEQAIKVGAQAAVIASGGKLAERADSDSIAHVLLPTGVQPRMGAIYNLRAIIRLLAHFGVVGSSKFDEISDAAEWLKAETDKWAGEVATTENLAKQLALQAAGKTAIIYGGALTSPIAYKWKISWNENAKNLAFYGELPEFNHNEFMGWTSHPIEKPFVVYDIRSNLEHPQTNKRFEVSDRLLSGNRPKSIVVDMQGDSAIKQLLWGSILADFVSIYLAVINKVDPTPVHLIEKLKKELS